MMFSKYELVSMEKGQYSKSDATVSSLASEMLLCFIKEYLLYLMDFLLLFSFCFMHSII